ncbi:MAG: ATP-binding protein [Chloroflexota bacterium]|nr:ATP-binding protein [Chloroflexota bacterium]
MTRRGYTEEDIKVLDYPENIQRRPGMYVGGRGMTALHHLAIEVIDNAVDEALMGHCGRIEVTIRNDGSISITDDGRGIPVGMHPEKERPTVELAFTELHAGGKFEDGSYSTSGGLHGVGIKATNALSDWLEVTVLRDGVLYRQRHERGLPVTPVNILAPRTEEVVGQVGVRGEVTAVRENKDRSIGTGTTVAFLPNKQFLDELEFDFATLARRLQMVSFLVPGLTTRIVDERGEGRKREYCYRGGLVEYVEHLNRNRDVIHPPIEVRGRTDDGTEVEAVFQWHDGDYPEIVSFVNTIPTPDGGGHVSGLMAGLTKAINVFADNRRGLLKKGDKIVGNDTRAGLTAVLSVRMRDPQFTSQTKTQLGVDQIQGQVHSIIYEGLLDHLSKRISLGKRIVQRCLAASRARRAAAKARKLVMRRSALEVDGLPGKLADVAKGTPVEETTLYIVEGDSAGGSCKQARDRRYHAILPLRGKILNVERKRLDRSLSNKEVKAIVAALGAGVGSDFGLEDMRYGGVAILVDADVDGEHIKTLLYTLFWRLMRPIVEEGRLYVAQAPLYMLRKGGKSTYAYTEAERKRLLKEWGGMRGVTIQRYKGLGEMNPGQLRETIFSVAEEGNPALNEHLVQVKASDVHAANAAFSLWMGAGATKRRERLMRYWGDGMILDENGV